MKKILIIVGILIGVLSVNSCQDAYDIERHGILDPTATDPYISIDDLDAALRFAYLQGSRWDELGLSSIWVDECGIGIENGGQGISDGTYAFNMTSGNGWASGIWFTNYAIINAVNRFLDGTDNYLEVYAEDDIDFEAAGGIDYVNELKAQARALRANAYLTLISYFSPDPSDNSALGVMNMKDLIPELTDPVDLPRVNNGEIYDAIIDDLNFADEFIGDNAVTRMNSTAIDAIRARMALYRHQWEDAITYADKVMDVVPLSNNSNYGNMFFSDKDSEVVFKYQKVNGQEAIGRIWSSINTTISGSPFWEIGRSLFNELDKNDIRYTVLVNTGSIIDPDYQNSSDYRNTDVLLIGKWKGLDSNPNHHIVYRATEMWMIKAEAQAHLGMLEQASNTLHEVKNIRLKPNFPPEQVFYNNMEEALTDILHERRMDFAFEGFRYIDLGRMSQYLPGIGAVRDAKDCETNGACFLDASDYRFTLPIPVNEIAANPVIQQNPGY